ncbi:hypothetical protein DYJ25_02260 [Prevotella denticola]|nr:hypothetical protein DYJ25_02260 [Prevotella denticola]
MPSTLKMGLLPDIKFMFHVYYDLQTYNLLNLSNLFDFIFVNSRYQSFVHHFAYISFYFQLQT